MTRTAWKKRNDDYKLMDGISPMVWKILEGFPWLKYHDRQDIHSRIMETVFRKWRRLYSKDRKCKFSSFVYTCARNMASRMAIGTVKRSVKEDKYRQQASMFMYHDHLGTNVMHQSSLIPGVSKEKEQALCILSWLDRNGRRLTRTDINTINGRIANAELDMTRASKVMGYGHQSGLSMALTRMRERVLNSETFKEEVM